MLNLRSCLLALSLIWLSSLRAQQTPEGYYGQYSQDRWLNEHIFKNKKDGFFVDVGAYDGIEGSNTYYFAQKLGWKGICIEPQPDLFERITKDRPDCIPIKACMTDAQGTAKFLYVKGLAAKQLSGILELYDPRHLSKIEGALAYHGGEKEIIDVPTMPLSSVLEQHAISHIDYLSIDVEGAEMKVLEGIDFESCTIDVISIEVNYDWPELEQFFRDKDYVFRATVGPDQIWVSKAFLLELKHKQEL